MKKKCKDTQCFSEISPNDAPQYCSAHNDQNPGEPIVKTENPLGVSQWVEHGKRYGYWDYFKITPPSY